jgi:hypothetical protein
MMAVITHPGFWSGRTRQLVLFFTLLVVTTGFRTTTVVMWLPLLAVALVWHRRRRSFWIGGVASAIAMLGVMHLTASLTGGWDTYLSWARWAEERNRHSSLLYHGINKTTVVESARALLWIAMEFSALVVLLGALNWRRLRHPEGPPVLLAVVAGLVGPLAAIVLYLAAHPGYIAPLVPAGFVLIGIALGHDSPLQARRRMAVIGLHLVLSLSLFFGLRVIRTPTTKMEAMANAVVLQMSADGVRNSMFGTYNMWLEMAGLLERESGRRAVPYELH